MEGAYGEYWYILDVNPEPWKIGPLSVGRKNGKMFPQVGRDQQLHAYREAIKEALQTKSPVLLDGKLSLSIWLWRNQATYETPQARAHRKHEADATNMFKATEDACQGVLFKNDKDNIETHCYIVEQGPVVTPRVVIRVTKADDVAEDDLVGIMPDSVYEEFMGNRVESLNGNILAVNTELAADEDADWTPGEF